MNKDVAAYHAKLEPEDLAICEKLFNEINGQLTGATHKVWHGHPVWFINDNPIVGYDKLKGGVRMLFWSGQSFGEPGLKDEGSFMASEVRYSNVKLIDFEALRRWLKKAEKIQWDYKNIVKRRGKLEKIEVEGTDND